MRDLSYPEAALTLSSALLASGLVYLLWFQPALAQIGSDRRATRTLLFKLAAAPNDPDQEAGSHAHATQPPLAARPEPQRADSQRRVRPKRVPVPKRQAPWELKLDEGPDPLADLNVK